MHLHDLELCSILFNARISLATTIVPSLPAIVLGRAAFPDLQQRKMQVAASPRRGRGKNLRGARTPHRERPPR